MERRELWSKGQEASSVVIFDSEITIGHRSANRMTAFIKRFPITNCGRLILSSGHSRGGSGVAPQPRRPSSAEGRSSWQVRMGNGYGRNWLQDSTWGNSFGHPRAVIISDSSNNRAMQARVSSCLDNLAFAKRRCRQAWVLGQMHESRE